MSEGSSCIRRIPTKGSSQVGVKQNEVKRGNRSPDFILLSLFHPLIVPAISQNQQEVKGKGIPWIWSTKVSLQGHRAGL